MDEHIAERVNQVMELLLKRVEKDIQHVPPEKLNETAHVVLDMFLFKQNMNALANREMHNDSIMRELTKIMKRGGVPPEDLPGGMIFGSPNLP